MTLSPIVALLGIAVGLLLRYWAPASSTGSAVCLVALLLTGLPVVWRTARGAMAGRFAADIVASLAILGALLLGQYLAGLIIVLMQTGGEALERYAAGRASAALTALEAAAPRIAHRLAASGAIDIPVDAIAVGDRLLVRPGDPIPCDGVAAEGRSHVDTSRVTGEPMPVPVAAGTRLLSGALNLEGAFTMTATAVAAASQYARIVALVRSAQAAKAPLQRLADRYAVWFTPATLLACTVTYLLTREPDRVLAILVVATPCPLILAAPVAIVGGISRAARLGVIVRQGGALEQLAAVRVAVFDKTGTLTIGLPAVETVLPAPGFTARDALQLAASVEQGSGHLLARTVVAAAQRDGVPLLPVQEVREVAGRGVSGLVGDRRVVVGEHDFVRGGLREAVPPELPPSDRLSAAIGVDGRLAGTLIFADQLRPGIRALLDTLRGLGFRRTLLLSGDQPRYTRAVADAVGIVEAHGGLAPEDKVRMIRALMDAGEQVLMLGDGTNDAPALSAATVGVALARREGGVATEAADIVILSDDVTRIADAIRISRETLRVARQSIGVGLGLSVAAMLVAAIGGITPIAGALLQEGIDVAVILNALRATGHFAPDVGAFEPRHAYGSLPDSGDRRRERS